MADKHTERAVSNLRARHTDAARRVAAHIAEYAGYILRDLDAGQIPAYHLVDDAVELDKRISALDAIRDLSGIYEAADVTIEER
jgi:hypothetical protein